ncbi:hypothetical protein ACH47Z_11500 [Streptomyces sp. NPDC020192]|uniref:hypothetical protein n=1 Tax=Streptomyces sp. NPDC020192 TaxID=3365066 RepID=UPI00379DCB8B
MGGHEVLLNEHPIDVQLGKVAGLTPEHERIRAVRLPAQVLGVADARRRMRPLLAPAG